MSIYQVFFTKGSSVFSYSKSEEIIIYYRSTTIIPLVLCAMFLTIPSISKHLLSPRECKKIKLSYCDVLIFLSMQEWCFEFSECVLSIDNVLTSLFDILGCFYSYFDIFIPSNSNFYRIYRDYFHVLMIIIHFRINAKHFYYYFEKEKKHTIKINRNSKIMLYHKYYFLDIRKLFIFF
jgi:hypothetical protein